MTHTALTEAPPITPFEHRLMVCSALEQTRALLPYLNAEGLHEVRAWLRHPDTLHVLAGTQAAVLRGYLLDAICRRLVELTHYTPDYFIGVGDMLPDIPSTFDGPSITDVRSVDE